MTAAMIFVCLQFCSFLLRTLCSKIERNQAINFTSFVLENILLIFLLDFFVCLYLPSRVKQKQMNRVATIVYLVALARISLSRRKLTPPPPNKQVSSVCEQASPDLGLHSRILHTILQYFILKYSKRTK